jgi:hypothetical protein
MQSAHPHDDYQRMLEAARLHANTLRREAIQDAWACAGSATVRAVRSANRLAHALARHARLRSQQEGA